MPSFGSGGPVKAPVFGQGMEHTGGERPVESEEERPVVVVKILRSITLVPKKRWERPSRRHPPYIYHILGHFFKSASEFGWFV